MSTTTAIDLALDWDLLEGNDEVHENDEEVEPHT